MLYVGNPGDHSLQQRASDFLISIGLVWEGFSVALRSLQLKYETSYPHEAAFETVMNSSLRLLTAGFDAYVVNMARSALGTRSMIELDFIGTQCATNISHWLGVTAIAQRDVAALLANCILHQKVIVQLQTLGGDPNQENAYGFTSMHNAAALGNTEILVQLMQLKGLANGMTRINQTPSHIAATRGMHGAVQTLREYVIKQEVVRDRLCHVNS